MPPYTHTLVAFDLDDTLYNEIDYLQSAYHEIAVYAATNAGRDLSEGERVYEDMLRAYRNRGNAFQRLNEALNAHTPVDTYLQMYRSHRPNIHLAPEVRETLDALSAAGCTLALITDGRSLQQRNKIAALGLDRWIADADIVISEEIGSEKPDEANYHRLMELHPDAARFVYVGDNPKKDFLAPNKLSWTTVCLLDNGENIHQQCFDGLPSQYQPQHCLSSLSELKRMLAPTQ